MFSKILSILNNKEKFNFSFIVFLSMLNSTFELITITSIIPIFAFSLIQSIQAQDMKNNPTIENPFFTDYKTPYEIPPFDLIKNEHFKPTYIKGIEAQQKEIEAIKNNKTAANFKNTIDVNNKIENEINLKYFLKKK